MFSGEQFPIFVTREKHLAMGQTEKTDAHPHITSTHGQSVDRAALAACAKRCMYGTP